MIFQLFVRLVVPSTLLALLATGCCNNAKDSDSSAAPSSADEAPAKGLDRPENWERRVHKDKGFLFYVPKGTQEEEETEGTTFLYLAKMPAPHDKINLIVGAVRERQFGVPELKELTKELLKAKDNSTDLVFDSEEKLNASFTIADGHYSKGGGKIKTRQLMALDVNDRYIVVLSAPEADFDRHVDDIDKVLANFEMFRSGKGSAGDEAPKSMPRKASGAGAKPGAKAQGGGASNCPCANPENEGRIVECPGSSPRRCTQGKPIDPCPGPGNGHYNMFTGDCSYDCIKVPEDCDSSRCQADRKTCLIVMSGGN